MTSYYEVLRPVGRGDLDAHPGFAEVLKLIPPDGYVTFERFRHLGRDHASRGISHACSIEILKRVPPYERVLKLESVKFWCTQINESGHKNIQSKSNTRHSYLKAITRLDEWLQNRTFPSHKTVWLDGEGTRQTITKSFANVEKLMEYCNESDHGTKTAQRVAREYLTSNDVLKASNSVQAIARSAIKSYFDAHDIVLNLPKAKKKRQEPVPDDDDSMSLEDFYKMMQNGKPSITMRTIMLITLQSGMDVSTFTDRFNFEGYAQIVRYFKTDDYTIWNIDRCPVPIRLVRVKTNVRYTTFLDRDAITQLKEYLTWKDAKYGRQDASKPLFLTKQNTKITPIWLSRGFSEVAVRAGIQKKISHKVYKMRAHEVRDLLKSTLIASGCARYAADHVLGHAPRDSYEKQATLYPEDLRREYAKASSRLNIFSKVENTLSSTKDPERQDARIRELESRVRELTESKTDDGFRTDRHNDTIDDMTQKINHLMSLFDSLPDTIKSKMAGKIEDDGN